jgi:hypothetical protein
MSWNEPADGAFSAAVPKDEVEGVAGLDPGDMGELPRQGNRLCGLFSRPVWSNWPGRPCGST